MQLRVALALPPMLLLTAAITAQTPAHRFEVASVKPAAVSLGREGGNRSRIEHRPNSLSMWNVDLRRCAEWAYGLAPFQVAESHLPTDAYDILAKSSAPVPVSELRVMLQDLLASRFRLTLHRETQMVAVYELVAGKGGPKLTAAAADPTRPAVRTAESLPRIDGDAFLFAGATMSEFARMLMQLNGIDLPVVDRTGIAGSFDIRMKSAPGAAREGDTSALLGILEAQLGLRLVRAKAPFEVLVVDRAEKPSGN